MNDYTKKWVRLIKDADGDDVQLNIIVEQIYAEGYEDGVNSEEQ